MMIALNLCLAYKQIMKVEKSTSKKKGTCKFSKVHGKICIGTNKSQPQKSGAKAVIMRRQYTLQQYSSTITEAKIAFGRR